MGFLIYDSGGVAAGGTSITSQQLANATGLAPAGSPAAGSQAALLAALLAKLGTSLSITTTTPQEMPPVTINVAANTQTQIANYNVSRTALRFYWPLLVPGYLGRGSMASPAGAAPVTDAVGTYVGFIPPAMLVELSDASTVVIPQEIVIDGIFANGQPDAGNEYYVYAKAAGQISVIGAL